MNPSSTGIGDNRLTSAPAPTTMPLDFTKLSVKTHNPITATNEEATVSKPSWEEAASSANLDSVT